MSAGTLISLEEYLNTSYSPDREYRDGVLVERNVGDNAHALLEQRLAQYIGNRRRQWKIECYSNFRIRVRENWCPIPDVCIYDLPRPEESVPTRPPLLWIEILSPDDRWRAVLDKAEELVKCGVRYVWIVDPVTLDSFLRTADGLTTLTDKTLRLPNSPIVIPLAEVMEE